MPYDKLDIDNDPRTPWILGRLYESLRSGTGGIELTAQFDDGLAFLSDFNKAFPGKKPDPNCTQVKDRMWRLLNRYRERGWCRSTRQSNYGDGPRWVTEWQITSRGVEKLKGLRAE